MILSKVWAFAAEVCGGKRNKSLFQYEDSHEGSPSHMSHRG